MELDKETVEYLQDLFKDECNPMYFSFSQLIERIEDTLEKIENSWRPHWYAIVIEQENEWPLGIVKCRIVQAFYENEINDETWWIAKIADCPYGETEDRALCVPYDWGYRVETVLREVANRLHLPEELAEKFCRYKFL